MKLLFTIFRRIMAVLAIFCFVITKYFFPLISFTYFILALVITPENYISLSTLIYSEATTLPTWGISTITFISPLSWSGAVMYATLSAVSTYTISKKRYMSYLLAGICFITLATLPFLILALQSGNLQQIILTIGLILSGLACVLAAGYQDMQVTKNLQHAPAILLKVAKLMWGVQQDSSPSSTI